MGHHVPGQLPGVHVADDLDALELPRQGGELLPLLLGQVVRRLDVVGRGRGLGGHAPLDLLLGQMLAALRQQDVDGFAWVGHVTILLSRPVRPSRTHSRARFLPLFRPVLSRARPGSARVTAEKTNPARPPGCVSLHRGAFAAKQRPCGQARRPPVLFDLPLGCL